MGGSELPGREFTPWSESEEAVPIRGGGFFVVGASFVVEDPRQRPERSRINPSWATLVTSRPSWKSRPVDSPRPLLAEGETWS